ncbi:MAG TPA: peptidoglycan DD-metalloendopeptidase family protein [Noviherbaspirillum sp.]|jgi:murein DD-endopeptidase MepM/ murein hydrolase activator NlpD|uniref:peptidoglycan DD-metalloendopeptidase family protein n=1 Tax=Noviherbaspirillum sp. TaxID=1926288 RepID=UPI002DDCF533|nr:peptidoglycan DD-metalloendopeptidase family protein [Noviherbaspirillum sp.]HEV2610918.1 peptidoglycan DD-metalloendopeptidase family protein [Noviherbaspirillum sp.]
MGVTHREGRYYVVKKGDSLWGIARHFKYDIEKLAAYNGLTGKKKSLIAIGQRIYFPDGVTSPDLKLSVKVVGLSSKPVKNAKLRVTHDGRENEMETDGLGWLHGINIQDHLKGLKIEFLNYESKWEKILNEDILPLGEKILQINILTDLIKGRTLKKAGPPLLPDRSVGNEIRKDTPQPKAPAAPGKRLPPVPAQPVVLQTRTSDGLPATINAPLFASENLYLKMGNEKFRQALIESAKRYGFTPHALAAIINAEAAKTKDGTWIETSAAAGSSARGLGQFLPAAWFEYIAKDGTLGNKEALKKIRTTRLFAANKSLYKEENKKRIEIDGSTKTSILEWRDNGAYSIDAIASYAEDNLNYLSKKGINAKALPPDEKLKIAYIMHHEGPTGGALYLRGKLGATDGLTRDQAEAKLAKQFRTRSDDGLEKAKAIADRFEGDYIKAYYYFIANHTDTMVRVKNFMLLSKDFQERSAYEVIHSLSGIAVEKPSSEKASSATKASTISQSHEVKPHKNVGGTPGWCDPLTHCAVRIGGYRDSESNPNNARLKSLFEGGGRANKHTGLDLAAVPGTDIFAVANGEVLYAGIGGNYGNIILLKVNINDLPRLQKRYAESISGIVNGTIYFMYAHLSTVDVKKTRAGFKPVYAGQTIGKTGDTGNAKGMTEIGPFRLEKYGAHLHFEVRRSQNLKKGKGEWFDPKPFLNSCN